MLSSKVQSILNDASSHVTVLTGAGISAESGIPTFRGPEGFWTVGSRVYTPQEIATNTMFTREPEQVWRWYLQRLYSCREAEPNPGHRALAAMEAYLGDRFTLITQNIDNLHIRAGNSPQRTLQIHGNITKVRCARHCGEKPQPLPEELTASDTPGEMLNLLRCRGCGGWQRPHVLWFDEYYNEEWFRADSALKTAAATDLLIIAGTSGATTLPNHIAALAVRNGIPVIDINIEPSPFSDVAAATPGGMFIQQTCSDAFTAVADCVACGS